MVASTRGNTNQIGSDRHHIGVLCSVNPGGQLNAKHDSDSYEQK